MITIKQDDKHLYVDGHAGFDELGKDIVCSAVSILVYTAAHYGWMESEPGHAVVRTTPEAKEFAMTGFRMLAEHYPDNVRLEE